MNHTHPRSFQEESPHSLVEARAAFVARCDPDPLRRRTEISALDRLIALSVVDIASEARFEPTQSRKNTSVAFVRICDGKMLWKAVVQQGERKIELLPRGYFKSRAEAFADLAALWNRMPLKGAHISAASEVPTLRLRLLDDSAVWSAVEASIRWASRC